MVIASVRGDRGGGHHQHMGRILALRPELGSLRHSKPVLLVDYRYAKAMESHRVFYHGMRAYQYLDIAGGKSVEYLLPFLALDDAGEEFYPDVHALQEKIKKLKSKEMDKRRKPAIREPRPHLTMEEMRSYLTSLREIESVTGIRYIKLQVTPKMVIGFGEPSGKKCAINLVVLVRAHNECMRFKSPEDKNYIFMGHSPAVALLRRLQNRQPFDTESFQEEEEK